MSEFDVEPIPGLPESLPEGERILCQQVPLWRSYARRVFQFNKIALYFALVIIWVAGSSYASGGTLSAALRPLAWVMPPTVGVLGLVALLGWLYARSTIYTLTNRRVVIRSGLALPSAVNLPFEQIDCADLKTYADGSGDIDLTLNGPRALYSMIWPNLRLLRLKQPVPVLRSLPEPHMVAELLGRTLAASDEREPQAATTETASKPERETVRDPVTA